MLVHDRGDAAGNGCFAGEPELARQPLRRVEQVLVPLPGSENRGDFLEELTPAAGGLLRHQGALGIGALLAPFPNLPIETKPWRSWGEPIDVVGIGVENPGAGRKFILDSGYELGLLARAGLDDYRRRYAVLRQKIVDTEFQAGLK